MERWFKMLKGKCLWQEEYSTPAELKGDHREARHMVQQRADPLCA